MLAFITKRTLCAIPILIAVNLLLFVLFFLVNKPDSMARKVLGEKNITQKQIDDWVKKNDYHFPKFYNGKEEGTKKLTETIFWKKSVPLFFFDFGKSDNADRLIWQDMRERIPYSLSITVPMMFIGLVVNVFIAMIVAFYRGSYVDTVALFVTVVLMSISSLFYIIVGQFIFARELSLFPVSGYGEGIGGYVKFLTLPIIIGLVSGIGGSVRYYRTIFLEEINQDYIRTARAKGLSEGTVLFKHALKNSMLPILTNLVLSIPFLIMGNLLLEKFFAIPGLGDYTLSAIQGPDFAVVRAMVFLGSVIYIVGLICVDISYTLVDPRVRLK